jgi:RimJ/RimL family protein N-acetyltransferase
VNRPIVLPNPLPSDGVVTLRPWTKRDLPEVVRCFADGEIARWLPPIPQPYTDEDAREWFDTLVPRLVSGSGAAFAIVDAATGELLGAELARAPRRAPRPHALLAAPDRPLGTGARRAGG